MLFLLQDLKEEENRLKVDSQVNVAGRKRPRDNSVNDPWADDDEENELVLEDEDEVKVLQKIDYELGEFKKVPRLKMRETRADGTEGDHTNPLLWWLKNSQAYPLLSKLAKKLLCISATSAPSERVFSVAGQVITKLRSRLRPDNAACLVFLKENWKITEALQLKSDVPPTIVLK